jgi:hypothetical protein
VRLVALVLLGGTFLMLLWRHVKGTHSFPVWLTVVGLALTGLGAVEARWTWREHTYTQAVRDLTGRDDITVRCQRTLGYLVDVSGHMGYVPYPPDGSPPTVAYLRNDTCQALGSFVAGTGAKANPDQVRAIHVLTHEAMHLLDERDEAVAECAAMQRDAVTARALGADDRTGRLIARAYYRSWYGTVTSEYRSPECRPGGLLDEGLPEPPWQEP